VTYLLTTLLALALGWTWGHATARIEHILIGATRTQDDDELTAGLNLPDDNPGSVT
jgi:protocatechuate 3,4-dioxygenase beta subunit